jgi:DNA invertase Pin-like site-specific DNA recombinase
MNELLYSPKITPEHLARKAIVYLRQSSEKQVRQNTESQRLQYDMAERIRGLGWQEVEVISSDLGTSAAIGAVYREGFERVLSSVALGEVGIVVSREVSRLSRTDKDWCRLVEVCQIFGTLIGDEQQVYDLSYLDDQLVLGIKGTLSVVELKVLRQRMQAGQESKARRGELFKRLPVGYIKDATGKVVLHSDRRVVEAIQLAFTKFRELWSVRQTFQWFRDHDVELPAKEKLRGAGAILTEVDLRPWAQEADRIFGTLVGMHAIQDLQDFLAANVPNVTLDQLVSSVSSRDVLAGLRDTMAHPVPAKQIEEATKMLRLSLARRYQEYFRTHNIAAILYPTVRALAPKIRQEGDAPGDLIEVNGKQVPEFPAIARNTHLSGVAGAPSLTIPAGLSSIGVPVGLSLEGLVGKDTALLGLGLSAEAALGRLAAPELRKTA